MITLYVDQPKASTAFYAKLLELAPIQSSPTFVMFALPGGVRLGLWSRHTVEPAATAAGGGGEIAFAVKDVDGLHAAWAASGLAILQAPSDAEFGRSFVALDPDGHRLRPFKAAVP
jgi:catechol 2,3-dioxygenase-like lactoylglutathione lyase family enzyme